MQLTTSELDLFHEDPNEFISNEDNIGVRDSCLKILEYVSYYISKFIVPS
jgi:hypothetical protein